MRTWPLEALTSELPLPTRPASAGAPGARVPGDAARHRRPRHTAARPYSLRRRRPPAPAAADRPARAPQQRLQPAAAAAAAAVEPDGLRRRMSGGGERNAKDSTMRHQAFDSETFDR